MQILVFTGKVISNQGKFSQEMVIPGQDELILVPDDWPMELAPGTLNIQINDDGFPKGFQESGGLTQLDEGKIKPDLAIPQRKIVGNTLASTPDSLLRGFAQVWRAELHVTATGQEMECWMFRLIGSSISSQIELVHDENLRTRMNLSDGTDVKVIVWEAESHRKLITPEQSIIDWCEAARNIEGPYGPEKAMGYLIGEKFLNYLEVAETDTEWRNAIPEFVTEI